MINVCIIGGGYVGLTYAAGLAMKGFHVSIVDVDNTTCDEISCGACPIDEPLLPEAIKKGVERGFITATTSLEDVFDDASLFLVCVGTYCDDAGNIDLSHVRAVARDLHRCMAGRKGGYKVVCVKSTVVCGTTDGIVKPILEASGQEAGKDFGLAMSPEFLKEGSALDDILHPDKIVIGGIDARSIATVRGILQEFLDPIARDARIVETDLRTAELIKYAQNAFLATKISFINEMSRFSELFGVNVGDVATAIGMDARISPQFLNAGPGFGGSCFPKDVRALFTAGRSAGHEPVLLGAVLAVNEAQKQHVVDLLADRVDVPGKVIALLGLAFKANTGDTRESVARTVVPALLEKGAREVRAHDPSTHARGEFRRDFAGTAGLEIVDDMQSCLHGASACLLLTEWDSYRNMSPRDFATMKEDPVIVDTRRILDKPAFRSAGIDLVVLGESDRREYVPGS